VDQYGPDGACGGDARDTAPMVATGVGVHGSGHPHSAGGEDPVAEIRAATCQARAPSWWPRWPTRSSASRLRARVRWRCGCRRRCGAAKSARVEGLSATQRLALTSGASPAVAPRGAPVRGGAAARRTRSRGCRAAARAALSTLIPVSLDVGPSSGDGVEVDGASGRSPEGTRWSGADLSPRPTGRALVDNHRLCVRLFDHRRAQWV
jgi:hypothetical protein